MFGSYNIKELRSPEFPSPQALWFVAISRVPYCVYFSCSIKD